MPVIKITQLKEKRFRTVTKKDSIGNRTRTKEEYIANREIRCVAQGPRFGHFIIDLICYRIILFTVSYGLGLVFSAAEDITFLNLTYEYLLFLIALLLYPAYYFVCESLWQRTPGKFLTRCVVIDEYGNKPDVRTLALRSLLRLVPFEAFSCLGGNSSRGWHDRWSNTWVVKEEEREILKKLQAIEGL
jgi:uncharacterized RDD family membrane protein YckC